jgi:hypothetical protein
MPTCTPPHFELGFAASAEAAGSAASANFPRSRLVKSTSYPPLDFVPDQPHSLARFRPVDFNWKIRHGSAVVTRAPFPSRRHSRSAQAVHEGHACKLGHAAPAPQAGPSLVSKQLVQHSTKEPV